MPFEIKEVGIRRNGFGELTQLEVNVHFGPKKATIFLFPEPPLTAGIEVEAFAHREIRELAEAVLRTPSLRKEPT